MAEKKLLHAKRAFYEKTSKKKRLKPQLLSEELKPISSPNDSNQSKQSLHFVKETLSNQPRISNISREIASNPTVSKKIYITSEEEPNLPPVFPYTEPLDLKQNHSFDGFLSKLSSSEDSSLTSDVKHSSSEGTSSLIASTYRDAKKLSKKHESGIKETTSDTSKSGTSLTSIQINAYKERKMQWISKQQLWNVGDIGMEWKEVPINKPFALRNKLKPDNIQKIKDIIDKQKKKQEQYQLQLQKELSSSYEQLELRNFETAEDPQALVVGEDDESVPIPVRKVCAVKSLPIYKGFSAPPKKVPTNTRWRKQKNKYTIAKSPNMKTNNVSGPKRIKKVVKCESDFISASLWRKNEKGKEEIDKKDKSFDEKDKSFHEKDKSLSQTVDEDPSKTSPVESLEHKDSENLINKDIRIDIQSVLKENHQLNDEKSVDDEEDTKNETFSNEFKLDSLSKIDNDQNSLKENKKPFKHKVTKRKPKKSPEQKVLSPKIKPYDVDKVRDYMKKKKEERKKRHLEEHKKQIHEAQKRKESLEKLFEYQKQNKKAVAKVKPLSPVKKTDSVKKKYESEQTSSVTKSEQVTKESAVQKTSSIEADNVCPVDDFPKRKHQEDSQGKEISEMNQLNINKSHKRKQENMHIDVSVPKFISVSVTPASKHTKITNDSMQVTSSKEIPTTENKCMETKTEKATKSSMQENSVNKMLKQNLPQQKSGDVEKIDVEDSRTYKVADMFRSISTVNTPSKISDINSASDDLMEDLKATKFSETKSKEAETLKDLVKCINMMTKPLEPFLRTRKWVEDNPLPPPSIMKNQIRENSDLVHKQQAEIPERDTDSHVENSKESSFMQQVSGIGDINQLYAKILGRNSTFEPGRSTEKRAIFTEKDASMHQQDKDEIVEEIEGSILSADEYVLEETQKKSQASRHSGTSSSSSHFSDLQKANMVPDPFNLINTMKRKPLGLTLHVGEVFPTRGVPVPSKLSENKVPFQEIYKSLINTNSTDSQAKISKSNVTGISEVSLPSQEVEQPSFMSTQLSVQRLNSRKVTSSEAPSKISSTSNLNNTSFENSFESQSLRSSESISQKPSSQLSEKHTSSSKKSRTSSISVVDTAVSKNSKSSATSSKESESHKSAIDSPAPNSVISEDLHGDSQMIHASGMSEMIVSGTINSEYTLEIDAEESAKEEIEEIDSKKAEDFHKEPAADRASASGSSISEIISVVENSKGFRSSVEDLQFDKISMVSKHSEIGVHNLGDKSNGDDKLPSKSNSNKSSEQQSIKSEEQKSTPSNSSTDAKKDSGHSALLLKHDQLQSIPSGSQNSVTIDFRQPLRLTLSNGESVQSNQGLDLHDNQYLHTQVVTRVASEAAAAAATSAVIAVFETQKALLAEKNYMGLISSYGRSSSSKKTQYSSDFESSQAAKSSIHSPESSTAESKHSGSIPEDITVDSNNELSSKNGSIEEKNISEHSGLDQNVQLKSTQSTPTNTEQNITSVHSQVVSSSSQKTPQRSKRKISGNMSSPSPASLSDNESMSSETLMSSHSNFSQLSESALSDDSFAQLTLDVVRRMTHEEELRAKHQLSLLQFQEKTLVEKARAEMMWLELLKKKLREKGSERKVSSIKRRQKELILRLRQERAQLQCMQEAYRNICENRRSLLEDKKKLLKEPNLLALQLLSKDDKPHTSMYSDGGKLNEFPKQKSSSSTPSVGSDKDIKTIVDEESVSEVPEILKGLASNSSQESVVETQASEPIKTSSSSQNKSQRSSPNPSFSPLNAAQSNSNTSLHSNHSLESALQGLKKLEASKRHLTKREQRILQRRKQVESLLQWQTKLDSEEMAVRELEQKALDIVDHSKKRTKYYISSSNSINQEDDKRKESIYESLPRSAEVPSQSSKLSKTSSAQLTSEIKSKLSQTTSNESIPTNFSEKRLDEGSERDSVQASSATASSGSLPEEIKSSSGEPSIKTVDVTENGSQVEEVISELSYHVSPLGKDKSSSSDIYSESFESSGSRKTPSVLSSSSPFKNSSPARSLKKDSGIGIRLPLVPRNVRRHDSSGSDDSYTISQSETASDQSDIEVRIHALAEELKRRRAEAEKLKREKKKKYREQLKEKELSLQKQLEAYNQYIHQAKLDLEHQIESAASSTQASEVVIKPRIKWPRPEQVIDSRRVRKQTSISPESFALEKKSEHISSSAETAENIAMAPKEKANVIRKLFPDPVAKTDEESISKETSDKSAVDSKEVSEVLSAINSSEVQEVSEVEQSRSVSSEVSSDIKEVSDTNENSTISSVKLQKSEEIKSYDSDQKQASVASSADEKSYASHDTVESKSQTDTFVTESSSSKSSDLNSPQQSDDSSTSNRTVSSDDEHSTRVVKENSGDTTQKSETQHSQDILHESSSSEESISEIQSVINSASPEEELGNESSSKNLNCSSSDGCETHPKNELMHATSNHEQLHSESAPEEKPTIDLTSTQSDMTKSLTYVAPSAVAPLSNKKSLPSESEIVNIVNYVSSSLVDDAFQIFYKISKEKCGLKSFLNKAHETKVPLDSKSIKRKTAESLSLSLFNTYLTDAFDSLFGIMKELKNGTQTSETLSPNSNVVSPSSSSHTSIDNSVTKFEDNNEYPINYVTQDINENQIFTKPNNTDNFVASQRDQHLQELEQQLVLQQYPYFYRKIPNKPPPPYTPPSSTAAAIEFPFIKEKPKEKVTTVKEVTRHIDQVVDNAVEILLNGKEKGLAFSEVSLPSEDSIADKLELTVPHQAVFIDLVFDLTKEVVLEQYSETEQVHRPWLRPRKLTPKSVIPSLKNAMMGGIEKEIKKALKINVDPPSTNQRKQAMWSSLKLGRKKRDFVDTILISELKEEEPDWVNYDQDEITVKLQIADSIFNVLINDTVNVIKDLQLKMDRCNV